MESLTLHPKNKEQLSIIKAVARALKVPFENKKMDETDYLNSTEANRNALDESINQAENGQYKKIDIAGLWK